jgi:hypothetical protein
LFDSTQEDIVVPIMNEKESHGRMIAPLGSIEPHAPLLTIPPIDQAIFKMMTAENLLCSIDGNYLHFNRVDSYTDFPGADANDGQQLPKDHIINANIRFEKSPDHSAANYYDQSRARTYACCFSLENTDFIWEKYANSSSIGKVCIVFNFGKLRDCLNKILQANNCALVHNGNICRQIFSLNYGIVEYVEWQMHQVNKERLQNPIIYTYLKDTQFSKEKELRISLSAQGMGEFVLKDGSTIQFPNSFQFYFNFREALSKGIIQQLLYPPECDSNLLKSELYKRQIESIDA